MQTKLFIAGEWRDGSTNETIAVTDPATGKPLRRRRARSVVGASDVPDRTVRGLLQQQYVVHRAILTHQSVDPSKACRSCAHCAQDVHAFTADEESSPQFVVR
jgi:hypothetical protein